MMADARMADNNDNEACCSNAATTKDSVAGEHREQEYCDEELTEIDIFLSADAVDKSEKDIVIPEENPQQIDFELKR